MIKFFRKIRQKLVSENHFPKYLIYALGEILLVVIGILIALQINNWNESRKDAISEALYLTAYKADLLSNQQELERVIQISEETVSAADSVLKIATGRIKNVDIRNITRLIFTGTSYSIFVNQGATVKELLASGDLKIIENDTLRNSIASWEATVAEIRSFETPNSTSAIRLFRIIRNHFDLYKGYFGESPTNPQQLSKLFSNQDYLNELTDRVRQPKYLSQLYQQEKSNIDELLRIIETELKNENTKK